jgi:hypothetical protein
MVKTEYNLDKNKNVNILKRSFKMKEVNGKDKGPSPLSSPIETSESKIPLPSLSEFIIPSGKVVGDPIFILEDPKSDSKGSFTYTSSDPNVAEISGKKVIIKGLGSTVITAIQAADGDKYASISIKKELLIERPASLILKYMLGSEENDIEEYPYLAMLENIEDTLYVFVMSDLKKFTFPNIDHIDYIRKINFIVNNDNEDGEEGTFIVDAIYDKELEVFIIFPSPKFTSKFNEKENELSIASIEILKS